MSAGPYILSGAQIVTPDRRVVAELHGMATPEGRERAALILCALNADMEREATLARLRAQAREYASSATATDDDVRGLAYILTQLIGEIAQ